MHDQLAEKFAALFAQAATTGDTAELRKEAAAHALVKAGGFTDVATSPFVLAPLAGAAIGGTAGYVNTKKDKRKLRNALYGALTGGLGGLGGAMLLPQAKELLRGADDKKDSGPTDLTTNGVKLPSLIGDPAGAATGGYFGQKWLADWVSKKFPANAGELDRLANLKRTGSGKPDYLKPLTELFDMHGPGGKPVTESFRPLPKVGPAPQYVDFARGLIPNTKRYQAAMQALREAKARHTAELAARAAEEARHAANKPIAEALLKARSRSANPAAHQHETELLAEMLQSRDPKMRATGAGTGTLHTDLAKVQRRLPGRLARGVGGVGGGIIGGALMDYVINAVQNNAAKLIGAAPTPDK